jgi:hypothetical protein
MASADARVVRDIERRGRGPIALGVERDRRGGTHVPLDRLRDEDVVAGLDRDAERAVGRGRRASDLDPGHRRHDEDCAGHRAVVTRRIGRDSLDGTRRAGMDTPVDRNAGRRACRGSARDSRGARRTGHDDRADGDGRDQGNETGDHPGHGGTAAGWRHGQGTPAASRGFRAVRVLQGGRRGAPVIIDTFPRCRRG